MKYLIPVVLFVVTFISVYYYTVEHRGKKAPKVEQLTCATIHKPKTGCPNGWREIKGTFTERDGSQVNACVAPDDAHLKPCTDYLAPGESQHFRLFIERPKLPALEEPRT